MAGQSSAEGQSTDRGSGAAAQDRAVQQPAGLQSADQLGAPRRLDLVNSVVAVILNRCYSRGFA